MPIAAVFIFAFRGGPGAFLRAPSSQDAQFAFRFSLLIAFATAAINAFVGTFAAYVLSKYRFPGKRSLTIMVNLPVAIPTVVIGTSLLLLWGPIGLLGQMLQPLGLQPMFSPVGVLLAHLVVTFPYMLGTIKPLLDELESTYEEAAYTIGASRWQTFFHIILPALRKGLSPNVAHIRPFAGGIRRNSPGVGKPATQNPNGPLFIFAQFEAGNIETANAVAAALALLSFVLFFFLFRYTGERVI